MELQRVLVEVAQGLIIATMIIGILKHLASKE